MAVKNFSRHMPNSHDEPLTWGKRDKGPGLQDRAMGAIGEGAQGAAAGSAFGTKGAIIGGILGAAKGFFGTGKGKGAEKLMKGAESGARALAAKKKLDASKSQGSVGKVKADSKDEFLKKGERVTKAQVQPSGEFEGY